MNDGVKKISMSSMYGTMRNPNLKAGGGGPMPLGFPPNPDYGDEFKKDNVPHVYTGYGLHSGWSTVVEFKDNNEILFPVRVDYGTEFIDPYKQEWIFLAKGFFGNWVRLHSQKKVNTDG